MAHVADRIALHSSQDLVWLRQRDLLEGTDSLLDVVCKGVVEGADPGLAILVFFEQFLYLLLVRQLCKCVKARKVYRCRRDHRTRELRIVRDLHCH